MKLSPNDRLGVSTHEPPKAKKRTQPPPPPPPRPPRPRKKASKWTWWLKWAFISSIWIAFIGGIFFLWFSYDLPDITKLQQTERRPSITILAKDGTKLATYGDLHGQMVEIKKLPPHVIQALLAIEDRRFYSHFGVDILGLLRAFWVNSRAGHVVQGGSTITQQLAKNFLQSEKLYNISDRSLRRKVQEALLALWLERKFTKDQILTMYLNRVYLGSGTFGLAAASQHYFGKRPQDLSIYEAAVIAGLLKAPSKYSPSNNPQLADQRAAQVLENMVREGNISEGAKEAALALASSASETFRGSAIRYFTDWIVDLLETKMDVSDKDLIVTTTLDPRLQTLAEAKLRQVLEEKEATSKFSQMALVSMDYEGAIRALLGGVNYKKSQFNRATQALRQAGSAFKPILYLAALEAGMTPFDRISDLPVQIGGWRPKNNSQYKTQGEISLQDALAYSSNTVTVRLAQQLGLSRIVQTARRLGITAPLPDDLTIVLGTGETTLLELTTVYAAFARQGVSVTPYAIMKVTDLEGNVLYTHQPSPSHRVIDPFIAQELNQMLQAVMAYGTGKKAAISRFCAGKTGTTQKDRDAWLLGFTSNLITGIWAGNDDNTSMNALAGSPSSRLWHLYMTETPQAPPTPESITPPEPSSSGLIDGLIESLFGG
jgi:penicillin-binding protein 1A